MSIKLICYTSFGYPNIEESIERAKTYVKGGCDCLEVDFPTDNAFLDSEYISSRMSLAYKNDKNFDHYFEGIEKLQKECHNIEIIFLAYEHTIEEIGVAKFLKKAKALNVFDLILVGMKSKTLKAELEKGGMRASCYVTFSMEESEIQSAISSNGFVYMQAKPQTLVKQGFETLAKCIDKLKSEGIERPIYCGVGVSTPQDITMIKEAGGNGAFIGSALMKLTTDESKIQYLKEMKEKT